MKTKYIIKEKDYELLDYDEWYKKYKPIEKSKGNIYFETFDQNLIVRNLFL